MGVPVVRGSDWEQLLDMSDPPGATKPRKQLQESRFWTGIPTDDRAMDGYSGLWTGMSKDDRAQDGYSGLWTGMSNGDRAPK